MGTKLRIKIVMPASSAVSSIEDTEAAQAPVEAEPAVEAAAPPKGGGGGSTSARDFLAMRRRQREERRARAMRWRAGGVIAASAAVVVSVFVFRDWKLSSLGAGPAPASAAVIARPTEPVTTAPITFEPDPGVAPVTAETSAMPEGPAAPPVAAAAQATSERAACEAAFAQQEWKPAIDSCTVAFQRAPDGALALKIAHAHWSRGDVAPAGEWAQTSMRLGNEDPDALVLVGHAQRRAGERVEAVASYRRYLALAPRGWHARKVRWLVRRLTTPKAAPVAATDDEQSAATGDPDPTGS